MNRHYFEGYQRVFINDINDIEKRLQEYDPDLYVMHKEADNTWLIMDGVTETAIMKIPQSGYSTLDARVYRRIREIHTVTGFSATKAVQESDAARERRQQLEIDNLAREYAKDMHRPVKELAYYGNAG
ncbi:2,3-dihydroxybenzoate--AMP ligase [Cohnella ginsengisoli]|uniref:2,3-dihydroxybenzoate--AMP ligase n=1 Tax=Cohnella ginsengisoli TaxID=425004 RepID=A0A9X4KI12_9BACL|nr:2,3-dihydroxybenzoate--AMP ligase [Cohnella ginsengisoli]MDG0791919.1 2,3-dihydroxybenzoate--AMP ligase [Cohnella ginsengisoli]